MSQRVLATPEAKAGAGRLIGVLGQMEEDIRRLKGEGQTLSDPSQWDGPAAMSFRMDIWPPQVTRLDRIMTELQDLQRAVAAVTGDILQAGDRGHASRHF